MRNFVIDTYSVESNHCRCLTGFCFTIVCVNNSLEELGARHMKIVRTTEHRLLFFVLTEKAERTSMERVPFSIRLSDVILSIGALVAFTPAIILVVIWVMVVDFGNPFYPATSCKPKKIHDFQNQNTKAIVRGAALAKFNQVMIDLSWEVNS